MVEDRIQLKHPLGKTMPAIPKAKYDMIKKTMLSLLKGKELTHTELMDGMNKKLLGTFEGSIGWYSEGIKLDLEARKQIKRTDKKPQTYQLT